MSFIIQEQASPVLFEIGKEEPTGAGGTIDFYLNDQDFLYFEGNASANFAIDLAFDAATTLDDALNVDDLVTVTLAVKNGAIGYYLTAFQIDGGAGTIQIDWQAGGPPTSGTPNEVDTYQFRILKTSGNAYTVFAEFISTNNPAIKTPVNISPANNATGVLATPTLSATPFYDLYGIAMSASDWQISQVSDFSTTVLNTGDVPGTATNYLVPLGTLSPNTNYYWRARYKNAESTYSNYSNATIFTTNSSFADEFIGILGSLTSTNNGSGIAIDTSGNVYVVGTSNASGTNNIQLAKYGDDGSLKWQRSLGDAAVETGYQIGTDSSGNVYICGTPGIIAKYDTNGNIQWQNNFGSINLYSLAVDSSGNVHICGEIGRTIMIAKFDTTGTITWQRQTSTFDGRINYGNGVALDSSGNVYISGGTDDTGGSFEYDGFVAKYNSSGTIQWQTQIGTGSFIQSDGLGCIAVDPSGNAYVGGSSEQATTIGIVAKYNTSGALQWSTGVGIGSSTGIAGIATDSSGNVYVVFTFNQTGTNDLHIIKYNTSGVVQFQRRLVTSTAEVGVGIAFNNGDIFVIGSAGVGGTNRFLFAKLPDDGSLTGTYTVGGYSITYEPATVTLGASGVGARGSALSTITPTYTNTPTTYTSATSTLTSNTTII